MVLANLKTAPWQLMDEIKGDRAAEAFVALCAVYPGSLSAKQLMTKAGLSWRAEPITSFVSLCHDFTSINAALNLYGWQADRTNGTTDANYWLSPLGG